MNMAEKVEHKSPYRQFFPGQNLNFTLHTINPDGSVCSSDRQVKSIDVRGGGFYGEVLIDEYLVGKTTVPNSWHDLWRRINWDYRNFPSQVSETQAQLDSVSTNLIADVLPVVTDWRFIAPHSFGYTRLPHGYAQIVEKMFGRPPRYDVADDEFSQFHQAQTELRQIGLNLGLEHAAQIHERNPFGMANLWKDPENNRWIWLDTLPAIPHKGWIWPFFYFRFHKDVRNWFYPPESGPQQITFNRIHTDKFREYIAGERHKFPDQVYQQVMQNLNLYDELWQRKESQPLPSRNLRGAGIAAADVVRELLPKPLQAVKKAVVEPIRLILNPNLAALSGIENAFKHGVLTEEEFKQAKSSLSPDISAARTIAIFHEIYSLLAKPGSLLAYAAVLGVDVERVKESNPLELIAYALNQLQDSEKAMGVGAVCLGFMAYGSLFRRSGVRVIGQLHGADTTKARLLSMIPFVGDYSAIVTQVAQSSVNSKEAIWHYFLRNLVAKTSSIFPDGGWGTEREGRLWIWGKKRYEESKTLLNQLVKTANQTII